jgi:hypothetical protein
MSTHKPGIIATLQLHYIAGHIAMCLLVHGNTGFFIGPFHQTEN